MIRKIIELLNKIQEEDKKFQKEKKGNGTWCCECKQNTYIGWYPFWHFFRRELCRDCGYKYIEWLKKIGAFDESD